MSDFDKFDLADQPAKKKRRRLSLQERIMIIDKLASGVSNTRLAQEFAVSSAAISKIGKNIENYINTNQTDEDGPPRKRVIDNTAFEKAIFKWYKQQRCLNEVVPAHSLREKAIELNEKLNGGDNFRAGSSWLQRFKDRYKIRNFPIQKSTVDEDVSVNYCRDFVKLVQEYEIDPNNIYNADETVLAWRSIPKEKTLYKRKSAATKIDTITILMCCNATGTHKLPLLIIGSDEMQESMDEGFCPFLYRCQKNGLVDQELFSKWYSEIFLPEIRERHVNDNDKCILIIDSAPPHLSPEVMNNEDDICEIRPIHYEVAPQIQPLNQGIVRKLKLVYKSTLINNLFEKKSMDTNKFCQNLRLSECCRQIADYWNQITEVNIKNAWQHMIVPEKMGETFSEDPLFSELLPQLRKLPSCSRFNLHNTKDWVEEELEKPGWQEMTDEEIVDEVMREHKEAIKHYEFQMQNNAANKKKRKSRKPLANNYEIPNSPEFGIPMTDPFTPAVVIKEEIQEPMLDEFQIKKEESEDEGMLMEQNAVYLDEYNDDESQPEEPEQDILGNEHQIVMMSNNVQSNIIINDVRSTAVPSRIRAKMQSYDKNAIPSAYDAMTSIDLVYRWFETKNECKQEDLIRLRQMKEIARLEILKTVG